MVVVSKGITPRRMEEEEKSGRRIAIDPHAWQSIADAKIYVANIRDGLIAVDPAGKATYDANADAYLGKLDELENEVRAAIGSIPADRRKIITTHDAFGYFGAAYGMAFIAPEGVSTEAEPSAKDVARIITQIKKQKIPAVFLENISDPRLDGSDRPRNRRGHRRHALFRRFIRTRRPGRDLHRDDAAQHPPVHQSARRLIRERKVSYGRGSRRRDRRMTPWACA